MHKKGDFFSTQTLYILLSRMEKISDVSLVYVCAQQQCCPFQIRKDSMFFARLVHNKAI